MKILLYGIGRELENIERRVKKEHEIIGYTDSFAKIERYMGGVFFELKNIQKLEFDYLVITIYNREIAWKVRNMLIKDYNIPEEKIIPFWVCAKRELWDIKLGTYVSNDIKGLIFGNSHAQRGFLEKALFVPFINLAVSSQDLYYAYCVFCRSMKKYGGKLKNLEYIVIDLYDYNEFNIDSSLSSYLLNYINYGGICDEHNFKDNKNFHRTLEEEMLENHKIIINGAKQKAMMEVFGNWDADVVHWPENRWDHIEKDSLLPAAPITGGVAREEYQSTVQENLNIMECFMREIRERYPNIRIVFTLIPRYITMEKVSEPFMNEWKKEFYRIITDICGRYHAHFWDYKSRREISENYMFYSDPEHLNTVGAGAMTEILNEDLKRIRE